MSASDQPYVLGLTGGIASGKTEAARKLAELGATIIDADVISHALTAPGGPALEAIRARFGEGVFCDDGTLDRRALADRVFDSQTERRALEAIIHPAVQREMLRRIDEAGAAGEKLCVLVVPLLYETAMDAMCDEVWCTCADRAEQLRRVMERDGLDKQRAEARIESQFPEGERERLADVVIRTNRPIEQTAKEIRKLYEGLMKRIG